MSYVFKVERCGSSLLTSNRISKRNRKLKNAVKVVVDGVHTAKLETENHLRRRLALMAADM
jgi:hypothetical protein